MLAIRRRTSNRGFQLALSRCGKLGSDAWWNDLPIVMRYSWDVGFGRAFRSVKYWPDNVFSKMILRVPMGSRDVIRPSGGSTRKIIFKMWPSFTRQNCSHEAAIQGISRRKLSSRQTLLPGITAQLYSEGYGRPTTLAAMKYTNLQKQISSQLNLDSTQRPSAGVDFGAFWPHCTLA